MLMNMSIYNPKPRVTTMRQFTISAAATMVFATLLVSAPATALENHGPNKIAGQCFTPSTGMSRDLYFGRWGACPQTASAVAPTRRQIRHRWRARAQVAQPRPRSRTMRASVPSASPQS